MRTVELLLLLLAMLMELEEAASKPRERQRSMGEGEDYLRRRKSLGATNGIMTELAHKHSMKFLNFLRIDVTTFEGTGA